MIIKQFQCPDCHTISEYDGQPGEQKIIHCPQCHLKGKITFPGRILPGTSNAAIEVQNLKKIYGTLTAVNGISFTVKKGEIFAFLGPNGAGKTTTVEIIESIREPTSGIIKLLGMDIKTEFKEIKKYIGILPQEFHSFERLTVRETLQYFANLYDTHADIDDIIRSIDLDDQKNVLYKNLSGGLKQRVGVAIALVNDPDIVFLDEPSTGLDPKARREVWEVIANLGKRGKTVFLTTHYMEEAEYLADHIAIIHKGNIIAEGTLEELIAQHGRGSILHIKKCENNHDVVQTLRDKGFDAQSAGNGDITVIIDHKERVLEILSELRHECIDYSAVDIRRSNLEEVFLRLTGAKLVEGNNQ